ncbi:Retrovirus-related Pol polyprotein from transposon TNT 1-94 [Senna tora]|uniref:Retrovirus-related Pol polyprotein from transposon TNT 1-94 n=1 Tax=Senna tora TaxID=362788 RepID=A0A834TQM6_9FABA|nr:Retrovirus-related Pol polyprotein from transposon TNT 1-94 [Senna tora]
MNEYLLNIKKIVDALTLIGAPISVQDNIETILDGLSQEYEGFITSTSLRTGKSPIKSQSHFSGRGDSQNNNRGSFRGGSPGRGRGSITPETLAQTQAQMAKKNEASSNTSSSSSSPIQALIATPETLMDPDWYHDSGATNHLTNNSKNIQQKQPYGVHTGPWGPTPVESSQGFKYYMSCPHTHQQNGVAERKCRLPTPFLPSLSPSEVLSNVSLATPS